HNPLPDPAHQVRHGEQASEPAVYYRSIESGAKSTLAGGQFCARQKLPLPSALMKMPKLIKRIRTRGAFKKFLKAPHADFQVQS
ncbi:MAG: hypothetical protein K1W02_07315, partial [Muribaculaceae bacterium]